MKKRIIVAIVVLLVVASGHARAALINQGNGLIYDTDLNITWYQVSSGRLWTDGSLDTRISTYLANLTVNGITGWRLPTANKADIINHIYNTGELGHLYYTELGNVPSGGLTNTGPFTGLRSDWYWTSTVANTAAMKQYYVLDFNSGTWGQECGMVSMSDGAYALVVHDGNVGDNTAPVLTISTLASGSYTNNQVLGVTGTATDAGSGIRSLTINGAVVVVENGSFSSSVILSQGTNTIITIASDNAGNSATDTRTIIYDPAAPVLTVTTPADKTVTRQPTVTVAGTVDETATVTVRGTPVPVIDGAFTTDLSLIDGINTVEIIATDRSGNRATVTKSILYNAAARLVTLPLAPGWNFISMPIDPEYRTIGTVLNNITPHVRIVWGYDNQNKRWLKYNPHLQGSTLDTLESGKGYWIYMDGSANLSITGFDVFPAARLYPGWNLVGYNGTNNADAGPSLMSIQGRWNAIWCWDGGLWYGMHESFAIPALIEQLTRMYRGKAYWIKAKEGMEWSQ